MTNTRSPPDTMPFPMHRFSFDCGIIFWRSESKAPILLDEKNEDGDPFEFRILDAGRIINLIYNFDSITGIDT